MNLGDARALGGERRDRDLPALALLAESILDRHANVVEEDLGEHLAAAHVLDRPNLDARRVHRNEQTGDAVVLRSTSVSCARAGSSIFDHIAIEVQIF